MDYFSKRRRKSAITKCCQSIYHDTLIPPISRFIPKPGCFTGMKCERRNHRVFVPHRCTCIKHISQMAVKQAGLCIHLGHVQDKL